jgi:excisionase family DNA binding protein
MENRALTINEFCDRYGICRETCYREIRAGRLRAHKLGRKTVLLSPDVTAWAAALPELRLVVSDRVAPATRAACGMRFEHAR